MLRPALEARLPLVTVRTRDTLNMVDVVKQLTSRGVYYQPTVNATTIKHADILLSMELGGSEAGAYMAAVESKSTVVLVNPTSPPVLAFDAGELEVPDALMREHLLEVVLEEALPAVQEAVQGLTIKEVGELLLLTMAECSEVTPQAVARMRKNVHPMLDGLAHVDTHTPFYYEQPQVIAWVVNHGKFLHTEADPRLIPRGVIMEGLPGVGKTESAKHIARELGLPLYRMDLPSMMVKWLGETESRLKAALDQLDTEGACVFLLDEVEKLFSSQDDTGVTQRILAQLLWWLQEHKSKVVTVMTTNRLGDLPPELYRPGRVDEVLHLYGLRTAQERKDFISNLVLTFNLSFSEEAEVMAKAQQLIKESEEVSHAELTHTVVGFIKGVI